MQFSGLLPPAIAWLALTLPRPRARRSLAGGIVVGLGLASLAVAGAADWRSVGLPPTYLAITAALLLLGTGLALWSAVGAIQAGELSDRPVLTWVAIGVVVALGTWVAGPVAAAGGLMRSLVALVGLLAVLGGIIVAGGKLRLAERLAGLNQRIIGQSSAETSTNPILLVAHLLLVLLAFFAPHLLVLLLGAFGAVITGLMIAKERAWPVIAGLVLLAMVSGFTVSVAGEMPLHLAALKDGPFSPAFELLATAGFFLALWPLLGLFPFHARWGGPGTKLAAAAILIRVIVPVLSGGTEHWQPLVFPLLVLSVWYAAGIGSPRLALAAIATGGLVTLHPSAQWAGVILLLGEALVSTGGRFIPGKGFESGLIGLVAVLMMGALVPLLTGALQTQVFYTVLLAAGLALVFLVREPSRSR